MTDVLSADEIDQLLTAINAGTHDPETFNPAAPSHKIKIYDFKRPDLYSKDNIRAICLIFESFARKTTTRWSSQFLKNIHVHGASESIAEASV